MSEPDAAAERRAKIIERIRKLRDHLDGRSPDELATFLEAASRLQVEHKISDEELELPKEAFARMVFDPSCDLLAPTSQFSTWTCLLAAYVGSLTMTAAAEVRHTGTNLARIVLYGRPSDLAIAEFLVAYLLREVRRLVSEEEVLIAPAFIEDGLPGNIIEAHLEAHAMGCVLRIGDKVAEEKAKRAPEVGPEAEALVLNERAALEGFVASSVDQLQRLDVGPSGEHKAAMHQGYAAAGSVTLRQGLGAAQNARPRTLGQAPKLLPE